MALRRSAGVAIPDDGTSALEVGRVDQWVRRVKPQIEQVATPVVRSTSRKLGQPLVLQKGRVTLLAAELRRRMRRIELARPAKVVVVERDIMVWVTRIAFWRATGDFTCLAQPMIGLLPLWTARDGGRNGLAILAACRERPFGRIRSTGAVAADR